MREGEEVTRDECEVRGGAQKTEVKSPVLQ
jgi:hypothetical protein